MSDYVCHKPDPVQHFLQWRVDNHLRVRLAIVGQSAGAAFNNFANCYASIACNKLWMRDWVGMIGSLLSAATFEL